MRIIGIVPGAKLFGSEDPYADQYLFVNGYPKRISVCGGTPNPAFSIVATGNALNSQ